MQTNRRLRFIHAQIAWSLSALLMLTILNTLTLEVFFVVSLIGLLIIIELTTLFRITPKWRKRLWVVIGLGLLGFGIIVIRRIVEILPPRVF